MKFTGPDYVTTIDYNRLEQQIERIKAFMSDRQWRTHQEIADAISAPPASVSSQLRNLRMKENGGYVVERRARGERNSGLFEYRLINPTGDREYLLNEVERRKKILTEAEARLNKAQKELENSIIDLNNYDQCNIYINDIK